MAQPDPILDAREGQSRGLMCAADLVPVTFDTDIAEARAILSASAGTVNITTARGTVITIPLQAGMTPIRIAKVGSGGTIVATDLFLVY